MRRYNGIICKTILAALKSRQLSTTHREAVFSDALHSIRSLLCTSANCTPHERMFNHSHQSVDGLTDPSWLKPGLIYVKKHVRNKNDPEVEEPDLIGANPRMLVFVSEMVAKLLYLFEILHLAFLLVLRIKELRNGDKFNVHDTPDFHKNYVNSDRNNGASDDASAFSETASEPSGSNVELNSRPNAPRRSTRSRKPVIRYGAVPYE